MDRPIRKKIITLKRIIIFSIVLFAILFFAKIVIFQQYNPIYTLNRSEVIICEVTEELITQNIQTIGYIEPKKRVTIESLEYGKIENIFVTSGSFIEKNQPIMILSNSELEIEIDILNRKLVEDEIELSISQNRYNSDDINYRNGLLELDHQIENLRLDMIKNQILYESNSISRDIVERSEKEYDYWLDKQALFIEKWQSDKQIHIANIQLQQLGIESLYSQIQRINERLNTLTIRASNSGIINLKELAIGQSISRMEPLATIDMQDSFKLVAEIDEFYLSKIAKGDIGQITYKSDEEIILEAELLLISPEVENSKVKLEFNFLTQLPEDIISGQSFNIKIIQEEPKLSLVIENGGFLNDTGGNWIFLIDDDSAYKTDIVTGFRNSDSIEIIDGLNIGDKVIISSYGKYINFERLVFKN